MPEYDITFARSAGKELDKLDPPIARCVLRAIEKLAGRPRPAGCLKLTGSANDWRIRVADWHIIYTIDDTHHTVDIVAILTNAMPTDTVFAQSQFSCECGHFRSRTSNTYAEMKPRVPH